MNIISKVFDFAKFTYSEKSPVEVCAVSLMILITSQTRFIFLKSAVINFIGTAKSNIVKATTLHHIMAPWRGNDDVEKNSWPKNHLWIKYKKFFQTFFGNLILTSDVNYSLFMLSEILKWIHCRSKDKAVQVDKNLKSHKSYF